LIGEHRSPFRDPPLKCVRGSTKKSALPLREGLAPIQIFGEYQCRQTTDLSPACRDTGPALARGFVFLGFRSPNRRESPAEGFSLFAIRVNVPDSCLVSLRALRALRLLRDFGDASRPRSYFGRTYKTDDNTKPLHPRCADSWPSRRPRFSKPLLLRVGSGAGCLWAPGGGVGGPLTAVSQCGFRIPDEDGLRS
jgi:hypothetical protein